MSDPANRYHDGFTRLEKADQNLKSLLTMLAIVSEAIRTRPADLVFMNGQPTTARQATTPLAKSIDAREWPDATRLQSLFDEWRTARDELLTLWDHVPTDRRSSLIDPDKAPGGRHYGRP